MERYQHYVYTLVKRTCPHPAEAEELAQDVFVKAYEHLREFRGEAAFTTWLYRIAFNTAISHARKKRQYTVSINKVDPNRFSLFEQEVQEIRDEAMRKERAYDVLERALSTLPAEEQMLISLYYKEDLKMEEVAYISGLTLSNTKVRIHRIRKRLHLLYESTTV